MTDENVEELARRQGIKPITDPSELAADDLLTDEEAEAFASALKEVREPDGAYMAGRKAQATEDQFRMKSMREELEQNQLALMRMTSGEAMHDMSTAVALAQQRVERLEKALIALIGAAQEVLLDEQFPSRTMEDNTFHLKREHEKSLGAALDDATAALAEKSYGTSGGVELTDELIEQLSDEAEKGYDVTHLRKRTQGLYADWPDEKPRYVDHTGWKGPTYHKYEPETVQSLASTFECCRVCGYNEDRPWHRTDQPVEEETTNERPHKAQQGRQDD